MKHKIVVGSWAILGGLAAVAAIWVGMMSPAQAAPDVLYVSSDGNCSGATPCYENVQTAVDAAAPGDEIHVAGGYYGDVHSFSRDDVVTTGVVTQVVYINKTITIRGGYTAADWDAPATALYPTMLDAQGQGRGLYISGDIEPIIEYLQITGGDATGMGGGLEGQDAGGGVYIFGAQATLSGNELSGNIAEQGGGLYLYESDTVFDANVIYSNTVSADGGGLYLYRGGSSFDANTIHSNSARYGRGGGLYLSGYSSFSWSPSLPLTTLSANTIMSNTAARGGGLYLDSCG